VAEKMLDGARRISAALVACTLFLGVLVTAASSGGAAAAPQGSSTCKAASPSSPSSPSSSPSSPSSPSDTVRGCVTAPGGPFLRDGFGRVLILHGVNAVYKLAPYEFTADPGEPNSLTEQDASEMAALGFDVVRLGILWQGLEPGTLPANSPQVCTEGLVGAGSNSQYEPTTLANYLSAVERTVQILASFGIYSLIDMHQDVYNQAFAGEGAPTWSVCTNGLPSTNTGNWSANYFTPAVGAAFDHFWDNDVVGGLQQNFDAVWGEVARHFADNSSVVGYDVFNEPFSSEIGTVAGNTAFDSKLECFYTGTAHPGELSPGDVPLACPPTDPAEGAIATIEENDPNHLVFYEPDVTNDFGNANWIGPMPYGHLVLDFHDYCLASDGESLYDFEDSAFCSDPESLVFSQEERARAEASTSEQPGGPAWFMSEFGGADKTTDLARMAELADQNLVGWTYWAWKAYGDPTGGTGERLIQDDGQLDTAKASVLVRAYAQAIAGDPTAMSWSSADRTFSLTYKPDHSITAPTVVFVPVNSFYDVFPTGYCVSVTGARLESAPTSDHVLIVNDRVAPQVNLHIRPASSGGSCPKG
jgi:endoglycosylceramidase